MDALTASFALLYKNMFSHYFFVNLCSLFTPSHNKNSVKSGGRDNDFCSVCSRAAIAILNVRRLNERRECLFPDCVLLMRCSVVVVVVIDNIIILYD